MELDLIKLITETMKRYPKNGCVYNCLVDLKECLEKEGNKNDNINKL